MHYETVIKGLTLEEKAAFLSGGDYWHTAGLKRLGTVLSAWRTGTASAVRFRRKFI